MSDSSAATTNRPGSVADRTTSRRRAQGLRDITTPDGVTLTVTLADRSERAIAVIIDLVIMGIAIVIVSVALRPSHMPWSTGWSGR